MNTIKDSWSVVQIYVMLRSSHAGIIVFTICEHTSHCSSIALPVRNLWICHRPL